MGSSDRPSQDAERDSGEGYDGTEGGGEQLESSHRPGGGREGHRGREGREHSAGSSVEWAELQEDSSEMRRLETRLGSDVNSH